MSGKVQWFMQALQDVRPGVHCSLRHFPEAMADRTRDELLLLPKARFRQQSLSDHVADFAVRTQNDRGSSVRDELRAVGRRGNDGSLRDFGYQVEHDLPIGTNSPGRSN